MLCARLSLIAILASQDPSTAPPQGLPPGDLPVAHEHDHPHIDDFATIVALHSQHDLAEWMQRHPWSIGTEVRRFLVRFDETRDLVDPAEKDAWFQHAAFLAEMLAHDTLTPLLLAALFRNDEQRAQLHTVRAALEEVAAGLTKESAASLKEDLDALRPPTAPPSGWESCGMELSRVAVAAHAAGAEAVARELAREIGEFAVKARDGELAAWSARFRGERAREDGDLAEAATRLAEAAEVAGALGDAGAELASLRDAVGAEEVLRLRSPAAALAQDFLGESSKLPRQAAFAAARAGSADDAWRFAEVVRARTLARVRGSAEGPPAVEKARRALAERELAARSSAAPEARAAVLDAQRAVDATLAEAERAAPRVAVLSGSSTKTLDVDSARSRLDASGLDALVGYVLGERETLVLTMNARGTTVLFVPIGAEQIRARVTVLLDPIDAASRGKADPSSLAFGATSARVLCAQLVDPIGPELGPRIGILPDGVLWSVPFEMFVTRIGATPGEAPRFLVEERAIAYLPSPALLGSWHGSDSAGRDSFAHMGSSERPTSLEIERTPLSSRIVFADCPNGAESLASGLGALAVTRGVLAAGAGSVAVNLWQVSADTLTALNDAQNRHVKGTATWEARRAAQLDVMRGKDASGRPRSHPYFWAAWVLHSGA